MYICAASHLLSAGANTLDGFPGVLELHEHRTQLRLAGCAIRPRYLRLYGAPTTTTSTSATEPVFSATTTATSTFAVGIGTAAVEWLLLLLQVKRKDRTLFGAGDDERHLRRQGSRKARHLEGGFRDTLGNTCVQWRRHCRCGDDGIYRSHVYLQNCAHTMIGKYCRGTVAVGRKSYSLDTNTPSGPVRLLRSLYCCACCF